MANALYEQMYTDALMSAMSGHITPVERDVLAFSPLPSEYVDPYAAKKVDAAQAMQITYGVMVMWIEEAKKVNYFSKHYVQLSKMIMNAVTTMGRGLVSLHTLGEDLSSAPMSVDDLLGIASYHFRKSYLGVVQTVKSHPDISERLLVNQLGWMNMLLRLYRTQEKLKHKPAVTGRTDEVRLESCETGQIGAGQNAVTEGTEVKALDEVSAIPAPAALGAQQAFRTLSGCSPKQSGSVSGRKSGMHNDTPVQDRCETETKDQDPEFQSRQNICSGHQTETDNADTISLEETENMSDTLSEKEIPAAESENPKAAESEQTPDETDLSIQEKEESSADETEDPPPGENAPAFSETDPPEQEEPDPGGESDKTACDPPGMPQYLEVLKNVYARSPGGENGELEFTLDEMCFLSSDAAFNRIYPEAGAAIRKTLDRIGEEFEAELLE